MDEYWLDVSDLTIFQAAFWMQFGTDPRGHEDQYCRVRPYADRFDDHPGGGDAVHEKCMVIVSAIRASEIGLTAEQRLAGGTLDYKRTLILKSDWLDWCRNKGYSEIADPFKCDEKPERDASVGRCVTGANLDDTQTGGNEAVCAGEIHPPASVIRTHIAQRSRTHALTAVIARAKASAVDASDYQSVWAELVSMAETENPPAPLLRGYVDDEGVKYQAARKMMLFNKNALRNMMRRAAKRADQQRSLVTGTAR